MAPSDDSSSTDEVTETTETSWLQRLGQAFVGIVIGLILVVVACGLLFWNEGRAVKTARSLTEGAGLVQSVAADKVDPAHEGKLIHVSGPLTSDRPISDLAFGVKSSGVRLVRHVQMFQWTETEESETSKKLGGGETTRKTYKYKRDWSEQRVDSSKFHERGGHTNPSMAQKTGEVIAPEIKLGAFSVPTWLLGNFGAEQAVPLTNDLVQALQARFSLPLQIVDNAIYVGRNPDDPEVGDYKIRFGEVPLQDASVVARQAGPSLDHYQTKAGRALALIEPGRVPAADMFKEAQDENRLITWLVRLGGVLLMFIGFVLILRPLSVIADVIPILGDVVGAGAGLVAFLCTFAVAPVVIAIAWFTYRPLVAIGVLVVGGAIAFGFHYLSRQKAAAAKAAKPAAA
ncbi:MAG TPA: TMEM43 family protein [Reyranella sp.]|nr:TMEM43 family protein [Reyranella sp.]